MATTSLRSPRCIPGITFLTAILATPRTPHRTLFVTGFFSLSVAAPSLLVIASAAAAKFSSALLLSHKAL
jgi:hypothetical protein